MGTFNTSCPLIPDLDGTCTIVNDECTSYTSNTLGAATNITNTGSGTNLKFKVTFTNPNAPPPTLKFSVDANLSGTNYDGNAGEDDDIAGTPEDPWVATATQAQPAVSGKGY